jgi:peroxiredoxin
MTLGVGDRAPAFTLTSTTGRLVSLSSLRGRPIVLVFLRWLG